MRTKKSSKLKAGRGVPVLTDLAERLHFRLARRVFPLSFQKRYGKHFGDVIHHGLQQQYVSSCCRCKPL